MQTWAFYDPGPHLALHLGGGEQNGGRPPPQSISRIILGKLIAHPCDLSKYEANAEVGFCIICLGPLELVEALEQGGCPTAGCRGVGHIKRARHMGHHRYVL